MIHSTDCIDKDIGYAMYFWRFVTYTQQQCAVDNFIMREKFGHSMVSYLKDLKKCFREKNPAAV